MLMSRQPMPASTFHILGTFPTLSNPFITVVRNPRRAPDSAETHRQQNLEMISGCAIGWDDRYRKGDTPWETGQPSSELQRVVAEVPIHPCRVLELGCGTGASAFW